MEPRRVVHSKETLLLAIDRLGAGIRNAKYVDPESGLTMSIAWAQTILRGSVQELLALREEHSEWLCPRCKMKFQGKRSNETCPTCVSVLIPYHLIHVMALEEKVEQLQSKIKELQEVMQIVLEELMVPPSRE